MQGSLESSLLSASTPRHMAALPLKLASPFPPALQSAPPMHPAPPQRDAQLGTLLCSRAYKVLIVEHLMLMCPPRRRAAAMKVQSIGEPHASISAVNDGHRIRCA